MSRKLFASIVSLVLLAGCQAEREPTTPLMEIAASAAVSGPGGFRTVSFPENDPGPPFYSRVTTLLNQIFHDGGYVAIPFYRDLACIPPDFNLLDAFHFPSQDGPGAFGCPLVVHGTLLIEPRRAAGDVPVPGHDARTGTRLVRAVGRVPGRHGRWRHHDERAHRPRAAARRGRPI
jgi:hypothetical protein